ncbi:hypothetical protein ACX80E_07600 [Arthrobacter sp. TMN-49]
MVEPLATSTVAASSSSSSGVQPVFILLIVGVVLLSAYLRSASRKRRAARENIYNPPSPTGRPGVAHQPSNAPYVGTLLNGVPLRNYDTSHGHQTTSFANERMKAEAELKLQLDALDTARRNGQVTAEQYAVHREAIFKKF